MIIIIITTIIIIIIIIIITRSVFARACAQLLNMLYANTHLSVPHREDI